MTDTLTTSSLTTIRLPQQWEWDIMRRYAETAVKSKLIGTEKNPVTVDQALFLILKGYELGITPLQSLAEIHLINGKPGLSVQLMMALANRSNMVAQLDMPDANEAYAAKKATVTGTRKDRPQSPVSMTFSMDDAKAAGLLGNPIWSKYPGQMLVNRAMSMVLRRLIPEALNGMYLAEELGEAAEEQYAAVITEGAQTPALSATTDDTPAEAKPTPPLWWLPVTRRYADGHDKAAALVFADKAKALLAAGTLAHDAPAETAFLVVVNALEDDAVNALIVEGDGLPATWGAVVKAVARHMDGEIESAKQFVHTHLERETVSAKDNADKAKLKLTAILAKMAIDAGEMQPIEALLADEDALPEAAPVGADGGTEADPFLDLRK